MEYTTCTCSLHVPVAHNYMQFAHFCSTQLLLVHKFLLRMLTAPDLGSLLQILFLDGVLAFPSCNKKCTGNRMTIRP